MSNKEKKNQNEINMEELEQASGGRVRKETVVVKRGFLGSKLGQKTEDQYITTENVTDTIVGRSKNINEATDLDFRVNKQIN